jgi:hypothetical protein
VHDDRERRPGGERRNRYEESHPPDPKYALDGPATVTPMSLHSQPTMAARQGPVGVR